MYPECGTGGVEVVGHIQKKERATQYSQIDKGGVHSDYSHVCYVCAITFNVILIQ